MPRKPRAKKIAARGAPAKSLETPAVARLIHARVIPGIVYQTALKPMTGDDRPDAGVYARDVIERMAPRDAAEEMLVAQLLFAHARVMRLTEIANQQTGIDSIRVVHEYADRASNTYRRLMLALAEYRRPPRTGDTFAVVKQTNIAGQQVIQNHENSTTNATNEQGCKPAGDDADTRWRARHHRGIDIDLGATTG
jgi:hypothetical protein